MKNLIIYTSIHHGNTKEVADVLSQVLDAKLLPPQMIDVHELLKYDLIGFGSGIYFLKHHKLILDLVDKFPVLNLNTFVFSTRGIGPIWLYHRALKKKLLKKECNIIGEFSCKGFNTYGVYKLMGGINKGKPNQTDLERAKKFAEFLLTQF